jgi:hypothetical protein
MNSVQKTLCGGCNLDRPIDVLVREAGFDLDRVDHDELAGPKFMRPWSYLYQGVATRPIETP